MKTRAEVVKIIYTQFSKDPDDGSGFGKTILSGRAKGDQFHYGRQDLRDLLDFIYGGPPTNDDECLLLFNPTAPTNPHP
jgi:hypothetical protein